MLEKRLDFFSSFLSYITSHLNFQKFSLCYSLWLLNREDFSCGFLFFCTWVGHIAAKRRLFPAEQGFRKDSQKVDNRDDAEPPAAWLTIHDRMKDEKYLNATLYGQAKSRPFWTTNHDTQSHGSYARAYGYTSTRSNF